MAVWILVVWLAGRGPEGAVFASGDLCRIAETWARQQPTIEAVAACQEVRGLPSPRGPVP